LEVTDEVPLDCRPKTGLTNARNLCRGLLHTVLCEAVHAQVDGRSDPFSRNRLGDGNELYILSVATNANAGIRDSSLDRRKAISDFFGVAD
jgi:hypothetical protein